MLESLLGLGLGVALAALAVELLVAQVKLAAVRRVGYATMVVLTGFSTAVLLVHDFNAAVFLVALVAIYRIINAARVFGVRMHFRREYVVTRRSSWYLAGFQLAALFLWLADLYSGITLKRWLYVLLASALPVVLIMLLSTLRNLRKSSLRPSDKYTPDMELPTVSVCIPARNETADLPSCLESVLASDYPKLEVLVLDDCSQDKTSEIIKGFAQKGVRFIKGEPPKKGWLAKNQAYQALADTASGEILLFCGVDVRFEPGAIRSLVGTLSHRDKQMISVLPKGLQADEHAGLIQPMRYWWELALPRRLFDRPPVLSTLWLIDRSTLHAMGGFRAVDNSVVPEAYFARQLAEADGYSFMRVSGKLMVATAKQYGDQLQTALRLRYPLVRKRPENVLLLTLAELWLLALPLGVFVAGFIVPLGYAWMLAGIITLLLLAIHYQIIKAWSLKSLAMPLATFPVAILFELYLLNASMWRYEFGEVNWKERNICIPVMRTIASLPKA